MHVVQVTNVNEALPIGINMLRREGYVRNSRNGPVLVMDGPVTTYYAAPNQRVLINPERDANPFFHLMECLWMMAGRDDVAWISQFNSNISNYSDNGVSFHGAYGQRWRRAFGFDQLEVIADRLSSDPDDRRCVLQMWDARADLGREGKDFPCNLAICFSVAAEGCLDMTVFNRSNDMIWGAYGANAVHMSFLQEVVASMIGVPIGGYWQVSNNFHAYQEVIDKYGNLGSDEPEDPYAELSIETFPIVNETPTIWFQDLEMFFSQGPIVGFRDKFFRQVVVPIYVAWRAYKEKDNLNRYDNALENLQNCRAADWKIACEDWITKRIPK